VLFNGTVRENIDPFRLYKDEEIKDVMNQIGLEGILENKIIGTNLSNKLHIGTTLDYPVDELGSNFSAGEK